MPCPSVRAARARFRRQDAARLAETVPALRDTLAGCTTARARADICRLIGVLRAEMRRRHGEARA